MESLEKKLQKLYDTWVTKADIESYWLSQNTCQGVDWEPKGNAVCKGMYDLMSKMEEACRVNHYLIPLKCWWFLG